MLRKIKPLIFKKIWGFEKWIYSSYKGKETRFKDNDKKVPIGPIVKIIKTKKPLSIQVHPDDEIAWKEEKEKKGKHESWYILESKNSKLFLGMKNYNEEFIKKIINKNDFLNNLNKVIAKKGQFYNIPPGLVHGLGSNITVLEVQECSDITYRYYDYDRTQNGKKRKLHIEKAIKSKKKLNYNLKEKSINPLTYKNKVATQTFYFKPSIVLKNSLIVDLKKYNSYWVEKNMIVNLNYFVVIKW